MPVLEGADGASLIPASSPSTSPPPAERTPRSGTRASRSPALRRSPRYSPYTTGASTSSSPQQAPRSPAVTRRVDFSSQPAISTPGRPPRSPGLSRASRPSPVKTGRPRDEIWQHYIIEREGTKKHGRCKYCGDLKKNGKPSGNLLKHLTSPKHCPNVPREVQVSLQPASASEPAPTSRPVAEPVACDLTQDAFEMALAKVFFVCALPFMLIEAQVFREFIAMVAPTMKIPSRHKISGILLKRVKEEIRRRVIEVINTRTYVSLVTDGWSDTNSSSIINFMVVAPGMPSVFWSSWSTRSEQHTANYLAGEIEKVIAEIESETTAQVVAVVTDNAQNMRSASNQIQTRRPKVVSGGCSAHVLNLLMQDVCRFPAIRAVQARAVAIARFVRDHLALLDEFKRLQQGLRDVGFRARNLVLPVPTRWYSVYACLRSVLNSQEQLEKLFLSPEYEHFRDRYRGTAKSRKKLRYISELIRDNGFWSSLRTIVRLLDPIIGALRALEADNIFVSGVYKWFRWLRYHSAYGITSPEQEERQGESVLPQENTARSQPAVRDERGIELLSNTAEQLQTSGQGGPDSEPSADDESLLDAGEYENVGALPVADLQKVFREKIRTRWSYVHTNAMAIAFMLDPATDLDDFVGSDGANVDDKVCEMAKRCGILPPNDSTAKLTAEILEFKSEKRRGGEAMRQKYSESSPRHYWSSKGKNDFPLLQQIAQIVFAIPTSSAASERAWSIFDHIHSKRRNRLSVLKVEMLAYIYINHGAM